MKIDTKLKFDFGNLNNFYFNLLSEEDFDFKTKDIKLNVLNEKNVEVDIVCKSILDFKVATNALVKSLEVIEKTINV